LEAEDSRRPLTKEGDGTISDFLTAYEPIATAAVGYATRRSMLWAFGKIRKYVGDTQMSKFSPLTLANAQRMAINDDLSPVSQTKIFRTFRKSMMTAVSWQLAPMDVVTAFEAFQPLRVAKKMPPLRTIEETVLLADELRDHRPEFADMLLIAAYTGMRYGEVAALDFSQIDFGRRKITVNRTITKSPNGYIVKMEPKTAAGFRTIPLAPQAAQVLQRLSHGRKAGMVFSGVGGKPWNPGSPSFAINKVAKRLGVAAGFHASRHYWASLTIQRGVSIPVVSRLLGHSSPQITMSTYAWCISDPSEDDAVLAALGAFNEQPPIDNVRKLNAKG